MIFGISAMFSISTVNISPIPTNPVIYDTSIYLGQGTFDGAHVRNITLTDAQVNAIQTEESFGANTIYLANFESNTQAGNYTSLTKPIYSYLIERRKVGDSKYTILFNIPASYNITQVKDYIARNKQQYEYAIFPVATDGTIGSSSVAYSQLNFFGWFLTNEDGNICYKFDLQNQSDTIQRNEDFTTYDNYTEYAYTSQGKRLYKSGKLVTMPYVLNGCDITIDKSVLDIIESFINDKSPKYLRNTAGDIWKVMTHNFSYKYMDEIVSQPYTISFDFIQIGNGDF